MASFRKLINFGLMGGKKTLRDLHAVGLGLTDDNKEMPVYQLAFVSLFRCTSFIMSHCAICFEDISFYRLETVSKQNYFCSGIIMQAGRRHSLWFTGQFSAKL